VFTPSKTPPEWHWPADLYAVIESAIGGPLDDDRIHHFASLSSERFRRVFEEINSYPQGPPPPLAPGVLRPACLAPDHKPDRRPGGWGNWWHRSTAMLLYAPEIVISEPLTRALAGHFDSDAARTGGQAVSVATALRFLRDLRPLSEAGVVHWTPVLFETRWVDEVQRIARVVNAGPPPRPRSERRLEYQLEALLRDLEPDQAEATSDWVTEDEALYRDWDEHWHRIARALGRRPHSRPGRDAAVAVAPLVVCERQLQGRGHPLLAGGLSHGQERAVAAYASKDEPVDFARLLAADLPRLVLRPADLVRVRLTEESVADLRDGLRRAVLSLPANITQDPEWRRTAAELNAELLAPLAEVLRRQARATTALGAFRSAGEGLAFSVAGLAAAGTAMTGRAVLAAGTVSAAKTGRDWVAGRRTRAEQASALTAFLALASDASR
jgi:hypothetical protein